MRIHEQVFLGENGDFIFVTMSDDVMPVRVGVHSCGAEVYAKYISIEWFVLECKECAFRQFVPQAVSSLSQLVLWAREMKKMGAPAWRERHAMHEAFHKIKGSGGGQRRVFV